MIEDSSDDAPDDDGPIRVEHHRPEDVFGLLGNETRLGILRALGEAEADVVPFSDLREMVGMRDSGQFNYHLGKLTGRFVRKTEDGYELSLAGQQLVGALLAGTYTATAETTDPIPVDAPCPQCGGPVEATYENDVVETRCLECEEWYNQTSFPPGIIDQFESAELPQAFDRWLWTSLERTDAGFCHNCAGRVTGHLVRADDHPQGVRVEYPCERCGDVAVVSAVVPLLFHPAGTALLWEHGVDMRRTPLWEVTADVEEEVRIVAEDPLVVEVTLHHHEDTLRATLTGDAQVTDIERID